MNNKKLIMIEEIGQYFVGFNSEGNVVTTWNPLKAKMYEPNETWYKETELNNDCSKIEEIGGLAGKYTPVVMGFEYQVNTL